MPATAIRLARSGPHSRRQHSLDSVGYKQKKDKEWRKGGADVPGGVAGELGMPVIKMH